MLEGKIFFSLHQDRREIDFLAVVTNSQVVCVLSPSLGSLFLQRFVMSV